MTTSLLAFYTISVFTIQLRVLQENRKLIKELIDFESKATTFTVQTTLQVPVGT